MTTTATGIVLYAFDYDLPVRKRSKHDVCIELSREDFERYQATRPGLRTNDLGRWIEVTDLKTGERWEIAAAPCGLKCHCAMAARRVP